MKIWQIGSGNNTRDYSEWLVEHDLLTIGPGWFGPFLSNIKEYEKQLTKGKYGDTIDILKRFVSKPMAGDIVLLRQSRSNKAVAIGIIPEGHSREQGYKYRQDFDDIMGWDLQHTRRVIWQDQLREELLDLQQQGDMGPLFAKRRDSRFSGVDKLVGRPAREVLDSLLGKLNSRPLRPEPTPPGEVITLEELGQELFLRGLRNDAVEEAVNAVDRQRRMVRWYQHSSSSGRPTEHEVVAHMILPLFLALGWSEQLVAIEWQSIDLACFDRTPTGSQNCRLVCEAKGIGHGLEGVFPQAQRYVAKNELDRTNRILVTDGQRFLLYEREKESGDWDDTPSGYLNIMSIRKQYLAPAGASGVNALWAMTPAGLGQR